VRSNSRLSGSKNSSVVGSIRIETRRPRRRQRLLEALDLPRGGRRARLREPVRDPVAAADPVEEHLAAPAEASGELLAVIRQDLLRHAKRSSAPAKAKQIARPVARSTTRPSTQKRE
jgi:hypothetical protein